MKKSILFCGGSKGIGAASIKQLLDENFEVYCLSRTKGELENLFYNNNSIHFIPFDLKNEQLSETVSETIDKIENLWGLVNNSSGPSTGPTLDTQSIDYIEAFRTHLFSANNLVKECTPKMIKNGGGRVVNIISVTARIPLENMCVSNTLRGAMLNWSKTLSKEMAKHNITVNNVLPGYTETDRLVEVISGVSTKMNISPESYAQKIINQIPLGRFGKPEEIASMVTFLLSDKSSFITGASIPVDGGWTPCP